MATYTATSPTLQQLGPELDIQVGIWTSAAEAIKKAGGTPPNPVQVRSLIDTGASATTVESWVVKDLGLTPVGAQSVLTPTSDQPVLCPQYAIRMVIPVLNVAWETIVIAADLEGQPIEGLIGRDFLSHCVLVYIGETGTWSLSF